jgi:hypothetical protein
VIKKFGSVVIVTLVLALKPFYGQAHSLFLNDEIVNPPTQAATSDNAKLTYLMSRGRQLGVSSTGIESARSIFYARFTWTKTTITVCFWNGTDEQQRQVMEAASSWTKAAPILKFDFEDRGKVRICSLNDLKDYRRMADIRVNLNANDPRAIWNSADTPSRNGDWAHPGRSVAQNVNYPTTVNLADVVSYHANSMMTDYNFTVRHEFGHALGLVHEHQRSACAGWFNIPQIAKDTGWSVSFAQSQVGALPETSNDYGLIGGYDIESVMQYNFSPSWYMPDRPGEANPCRRKSDVDDLSDMDKVVIAALYQPELNQTPARVALIAREKAAVAAVAAPTIVAAGQKADVEEALADLQKRIGHLDPNTIQIFPHSLDQDIVLPTVRNLGYPLQDGSGRPIVNIGHPTKGLEGLSTDTVLFTDDVPQQDIRYVALSLHKAGIVLKSIEPYYPSVNNKFTKRTHLIQIGSDIGNQQRQALSADDILNEPLPMFGVRN